MNRLKNNENCKLLLKILIIFAISRLIMLIMVPVYNGIMGTHRSFLFLMNEWDAKKYAYIINHGYTHPTDIDPQANWAFFPLYVPAVNLHVLITCDVNGTRSDIIPNTAIE